MNNKFKVALVAIICIAGITACSRQRAAANEWGCSFGAGMFEQSKALKDRIPPGEHRGYSNDNFIAGPSDVRFYYVDNDAATADFGARPIVVPAKGSASEGVGVVQTSTEVQVRFVINENFCDLYINHLKKIDDTVALNYNAKTGEESGWAVFLNQTMNQKLIEATRPVLRDVDYITLYTNGKVDDGSAYDVLAKTLSENLTRELTNDLGTEFFCGPSYKYDGKIDGKFEGGGCPPLEVTVKSITPTNSQLIANLEAIVDNEETLRKIESDTILANERAEADSERAIAAAQAERERLVAQAAADEEAKVAQAQSQQEIELAEETRRRAVEEAQAASDLAIAQARADVATQEAANEAVVEAARGTFCVTLAASGIDCAMLASAENGQSIIPSIDLGSGGSGSGEAPTIVVDARP